MDRLVNQRLTAWISASRRKPLIIRGARQVGKTWLVENILAPKFETFVKVDLEAKRDVHRLFEDNLDPREILKGLEFSHGRILPGKTLLFFDEIQACPRAIMALRYFYEEVPDLHVVAAGSLLEFAFGEIPIPVGRVQYLHVSPMTFYEYLLALNSEVMAEAVLACDPSLPGHLQQAILSELKNYMFIGGMPEAVKAYKDTNSMVEAFTVQSEIVDSYRQDFSKYTPRVDVTCLDEVFLSVARSIGEQLKYTALSSSFTYQTSHKAFDVLAKARMLYKIPACNPSGLPLGASANSRRFKACLLDIGLLQRLCRIPVDAEIAHDDLLAIYRGKLAEQFVAQEMVAWHTDELFYWSREAKSSSAEVDFVSVKGGKIYPVEVKSGPSGRLRSLHIMLDSYPNCPSGYVLYSGPFRELPEQRLMFMPLYATPCIGDRERIR